MLVPKRKYHRHKLPDVALNECVNVFLAGLPLKLLARARSMLRLDQAGNLTYFYLKVKHLSILPETWQVVWYRYY